MHQKALNQYPFHQNILQTRETADKVSKQIKLLQPLIRQIQIQQLQISTGINNLKTNTKIKINSRINSKTRTNSNNNLNLNKTSINSHKHLSKVQTNLLIKTKTLDKRRVQLVSVIPTLLMLIKLVMKSS